MTAKKPKLTVKETKLVKAKAEGKKHDEAWDEAGYSQNSSKVVKVVNASKILSKPHVQEALELALQRAGITPDLAIAPIGEALLHDDLDMRLKGSDRALKLMVPKSDGQNININFNQHVDDQRKKYDL